MPTVQPYLTFNGRCAEAFQFYAQVLDAKIEALMPYGTSPMAAVTPPGHHNKILHGKITIDGQTVLGADVMPGLPYFPMKGFSLSLSYPTAEAARKAFDLLAAGGQTLMPLQPTFWSPAFGMLVDAFGTPWMIGCDPGS